jgi:hypothetical protein
MMTHDKLFESLDGAEAMDSKERSELRAYLLGVVDEFETSPENGQEIAYQVAGLMAAKSIMNLPEGDPFEQVLRLAGELELPEKQRDTRSTWRLFIELVRSLPVS